MGCSDVMDSGVLATVSTGAEAATGAGAVVGDSEADGGAGGADSGRGGGLCREGRLGGPLRGLPGFCDDAFGGVFSAALMGLRILLNLNTPTGIAGWAGGIPSRLAPPFLSREIPTSLPSNEVGMTCWPLRLINVSDRLSDKSALFSRTARRFVISSLIFNVKGRPGFVNEGAKMSRLNSGSRLWL